MLFRRLLKLVLMYYYILLLYNISVITNYCSKYVNNYAVWISKPITLYFSRNWFGFIHLHIPNVEFSFKTADISKVV